MKSQLAAAEEERDRSMAQFSQCKEALNQSRRELQEQKEREISWRNEKKELEWHRNEYPRIRGEIEKSAREKDRLFSERSAMLDGFEVEKRQLRSGHLVELDRLRAHVEGSKMKTVELDREHQRVLQNVTTSHEQDIAALQNSIKGLRDEKSRLKDAYLRELDNTGAKHMKELARLRAEDESHRAEEEQLRRLQQDKFHGAEARHAQELALLRTNLTSLRSENQSLKEINDAQKNDAEKRMEMQKASANANVEAVGQKVEKKFARKEAKLLAALEEQKHKTDELENTIQQILGAREADLKQHTHQLQEQQSQLNTQHRQETRALREAYERLRVNIFRDNNGLAGQQPDAEDTIINEQSHVSSIKESETVVIEEDRQSTPKPAVANKSPRNTELISSRETYRGLTDDKVGSRFSNLANRIGNLARIQWDISKQSSWPLTDEQVNRLAGRNPRKMKQQIIQNCVWHILFNEVFSSPFGVSGTEGTRLYNEWQHTYKLGKYSLT